MCMRSTTRHSSGFLGKVLLLVLGFSFILASAASANLFLKFDGIKGGSTSENHSEWIELESCQWGVSATSTTTGGGGGAGKTLFDDFSWTQEMDISVTGLFNAITKGKRIKDAQVDFVTAGSQPFAYFQMEFRDVFLTNLDVTGSSSAIATIDGAFTYNFIKMTYTPQKADGSAGSSVWADFDRKKNKGSVGALAALFGLGISGPTTIPGVPVPASLLLLGSGLVGLIGWRRLFKL